MNEKIEIAKIAAQLTITILERKGTDIQKTANLSLASSTDRNQPEALLVFDAVYKHVQATLIAH